MHVVNSDILPHSQDNKVYKTLSMYICDDKIGEFIATIGSKQNKHTIWELCMNSNQVEDTFCKQPTHVIENVCDKRTQSVTNLFPKTYCSVVNEKTKSRATSCEESRL